MSFWMYDGGGGGQGQVVNTCQTFTLNYSVHQWIYINYFIKILIELGYIQLVHRGGSRKLWVGGSSWCKQGRSP